MLVTPRHLLTALLAAVASIGPGSPAAAAGPPRIATHAAAQTDAAIVPGEAIVRFRRGASTADRLEARKAADVEFARSLEVPRAQVVGVDGGVAAAVTRLERQPDVAYAQPNYRYRALAVQAPDDTFFGQLWGLQDPAAPNPGVGALEAWETTRGSGQVVAVLDTGVAADHPDLIGRLWSNPDDPPGGGDQDANGKVDDVAGYDLVDDDADPDDYDFHGTHVAGTIAASAGNGLGVAGVAPAAQVMAVRVLDGDGNGSSAKVGEGIAYAAREGADVINLSLGGPADAGDQFTSDAIAEADAHDVVVVAAAGNNGSNNDVEPTSPCTLPRPNLVCVAAVSQSGGLAGFSNYGPTTVDLGAPGTSILSTETDYDTVLDEPFDAPGLPGWAKLVLNPGSIAWGSSSTSSSGLSAGDSPGAGQVYEADSNTQLVRASPVNLSSHRGCRMGFDVRYEIEDAVDEDGFLFDSLVAGAITAGDSEIFAGQEIAGSSDGAFEATELSISELDGRSDVVPAFALFSDETVQLDGANVDNLRLRCRASSYSNAPPPTGNYASFSGTSMATPHVAGVAALVRAADPVAPDTEVVQALEESAAPLPALICRTVTGGVVDADAAIAAVLTLPGGGAAAAGRCPVASPPASPTTPAGPAGVRPPAGPSISLAGARLAIRVSRRGRFTYPLTGTPGLSGRALFRTRRKALVVSRRVHVTLARRGFSVPSSGRVAVRLKLSRRKLAILRRNRRLRLWASVIAQDSAGRTVGARRALTLRAPRRRAASQVPAAPGL